MSRGYFQGLHPAVSFTYFISVIGLTLVCMHPILSVLSFLGAAAFVGSLKGGKALWGSLRFLLPMMFIIMLANPLFNHRGVTMLFMLFDQWITLKARGFGQRRRTTYHLFHFDSRDARCLGLITALLAAVILGRIYGLGTMRFYPRMTPPVQGAGSLWQAGAVLVLVFLPVILERKERLRWRSYSLNT